jgi:hypothetical protein
MIDLYQKYFWTDEAGVRIPISEMSPRHAYNCTRWMIARAKDIAFVDDAKWIGIGRWVSGEQASYDLDCEMSRDMEAKNDPVAWIKSTELWQALDRRAEAREVTIDELFSREGS